MSRALGPRQTSALADAQQGVTIGGSTSQDRDRRIVTQGRCGLARLLMSRPDGKATDAGADEELPYHARMLGVRPTR